MWLNKEVNFHHYCLQLMLTCLFYFRISRNRAPLNLSVCGRVYCVNLDVTFLVVVKVWLIESSAYYFSDSAA